MRRFILQLLAIFSVAFVSASASGFPLPVGEPGLISWISQWAGDNWYQVRIEQRVIIRIPRERTQPASTGGGQGSEKPAAVHEEKIGKCILMDRLIGSRPGPKESLELATSDGNIIRAYLGDGCLAREFYAGAYVERSLDGKMCINRDLLHARTGAECDVDKFRLLVAD